MAKITRSRLGYAAILTYLTLGCLVYFGLAWQVFTEAATSSSGSSAWTDPTAKAIKQISPTVGAQSTPILFDNMDCTLATYRLPTSSAMGTGCFTPTELGLIESDSGITIFNGTDEGLPLQTYTPHQVLAPWPNHTGLFALDTVSTGGAYISLYKNPVSMLKDQRNVLLQLTAKQLTAAPETQLKDKLGQKIVINSQTLAFSGGGEWLVAETFNGSFVRINLTDLSIKPFAPSYTMSGNPALLKSRVTISEDGHSVAIYNKEDVSFRVYDLINCTPIGPNLTPENCASHDYLPFIKSQIPDLQSIRHLRFINEKLISFEAYTSSTTGAKYVLTPSTRIDHLIDYLGMGDSYTSGEGAFDYVAGTDLPDNMCHLSIRSYPMLLTNELFSDQGGRSVACSGAIIKDVASMSDSYRGQVRNALDFKHLKDEKPSLLNAVMTDFLPGYIAQQRFVSHYQPAIITVSVGGDDIGFGNILKQCVGLHISIHRSDNDCFNTYEDRLEILQLIDRTLINWISMFKQLKAQAPNSTIYSIGYPQIALDSGNCALNVHLSKAELEFGTELINYLNATIQEASKQAQVYYIDISKALYGHRMCEADSDNVAMNGLTAGKDAGIFGVGVLGKESFHPNALGQKLIKEAILAQTNNLSAVASAPTVANQLTTKLLDAPKSGRRLSNRMPATITNSDIIPRGTAINIELEGVKFGLKPLTTYAIKVDAASGQEIGSIHSSEFGDMKGQVSIPSNTTTGGHSIDIVGRNQADKEVNITQPIIIPENNSDIDGDGRLDVTDSCPTVINSGIDTDQDHTDDACDALIGQSPTTPNMTTRVNSQPETHSDTPGIHLPASTKPSQIKNNTGTSGSTKAKANNPPLAIQRQPWLKWIVPAATICFIVVLFISKFEIAPIVGMQMHKKVVGE